MNERSEFTRTYAGFRTGRILRVLVRKAWLVLLCALVTAAVLLGVAAGMPPEYEATALFYVSGENLASTDTAPAEELVEPIVVILDTRQTLSRILEDLGGSGSLSDLGKMISAEAVDSTQLLEIRVTAGDPNTAARIGEAVTRVLPQRIRELMPGVTMTLADPVCLPEKPADPGYVKLGILGFLLGGVVCAGALTLACVLDRKLWEPEDVAQLCASPVLDRVPRTHPGTVYRRLGVKLGSVLPGGDCRILAVVGPAAVGSGIGEGLEAQGLRTSVTACPESTGALEKISRNRDCVVLTLPDPESPETLRWAGEAYGVVVAVERGRTQRKAFCTLMEDLDSVRARNLGIVILD